MTAQNIPSMAALLLALTPMLMAGCDRLGGALGLTGNVGTVAPEPIGPERLRVNLSESGAQAVLGPVSRAGEGIVWQTLDGITLAFRGGMLTGTRGLGDDLMSADVSGDVAMLRGDGVTGYHPHIRSYLDGEDQIVFRSYQCHRVTQAQDTKPYGANLRRIEMRCISPQDSFTNLYWLDGAGSVTRSRQWVSPQIGYMETESVSR